MGLSSKFDEVVEVGVTGSAGVTYGPDGKATGYTTGIEGAASVDAGIAKLGGKASSTCQWDSDLNVTGHSNSISGSGSIGGNAENSAANGGSGSLATGATGNTEFTSTSSYDANGNYIGGSNSVTVTGQAGAQTADASTQTAFFGIQYNQILQVVAGQTTAAPTAVSSKW